MGERVTFADLLKKAEEKKKTEAKPKLEAIPSFDVKIKEPTPPTPSTTHTAPTGRTLPTPLTPPGQKKRFPVAPERDFTRVANSIVRDAVRQGTFIGKSKQIYDFLYLQTRGSIQPKRSIRLTKSNLMKGAGIGSERTLLKNLNHLKSVGFLKVTEFEGQHSGNEYEVFLPEETEPTPPTPVTAQQAHYSPQKVESLPSVESDVGGATQNQQNQQFIDNVKHRINTDTIIDDESASAFSIVIEKFNSVSIEITGKGLSARETEKWGILADLLILELRSASKRTETISSVPAFLTEVLRRQFFAARQHKQSSTTKSTKTKTDTVGQPNAAGEYETKPLDKKGREAALAELQDFADDDFLEDFKKWYTIEDWTWLKSELAKTKPAESENKLKR